MNKLGFLRSTLCQLRRTNFIKSEINYEQGEYRTDIMPNNETCRLYFYYIDHQGMLFLDDALHKNFTSCYKEVKFLSFFLTQLKFNKTGFFEKEFPYMSICKTRWGPYEYNYTRCDDLPQVFTHLFMGKNGEDRLSWGHTGEKLSVPFEPTKIFMDIKTGRIYHAGEERFNGVGLIRSKLAIELSDNFTFEPGNPQPIGFMWKGEEYKLTNEVVPRLQNRIRHPSGYE